MAALIRFCILCTLLWFHAAADATVRIAIVIDDLGHRSDDQRFAQLSGPLTLAILPHTPYAGKIAELATQGRHEVIVHMPMQPKGSIDAGLGMLSTDHNQPELLAALDAALQSVPDARGINNHMGSALTADITAMYWLMAGLAERGLYFLDSRTHADTQAEMAARQIGLPVARRHVFLDNEQTSEHLQARWQALIALAQQQGYAIAIGHPHQATYEFLQQVLPQLAAQGIELQPVSALLH